MTDSYTRSQMVESTFVLGKAILRFLSLPYTTSLCRGRRRTFLKLNEYQVQLPLCTNWPKHILIQAEWVLSYNTILSWVPCKWFSSKFLKIKMASMVSGQSYSHNSDTECWNIAFSYIIKNVLNNNNFMKVNDHLSYHLRWRLMKLLSLKTKYKYYLQFYVYNSYKKLTFHNIMFLFIFLCLSTP